MTRPRAAALAVCLVLMLPFCGTLRPVAAQAAGSQRVALVLGGGSARGLFHVGVLKALTEAGVPVDLVVGTSMGSIIGGLYAAGFSVDMLEEFILRVGVEAIAELRFPFEGGFLDANPLELLLDELLEGRGIEDTRIPFAAVAIPLEAFETTVFTSGNLARALHASMAIPIVFEPVEIGGRHFYDGGLRAAVPAAVARDLGATVVIAVEVRSPTPTEPHSVFSNFVTIMGDVLREENQAQLQEADFLLDSEMPRSSSGLDYESADLFFRRGYEVTRKALPELLARLEELGVSLHAPGDPHEQDPINDGWQDRVREARRDIAERVPRLTITPVIGLLPGHYSGNYTPYEAAPLSVIELGLELSGGPLARFGVGASFGLSSDSEATAFTVRAGYRHSYALAFEFAVEKDLADRWHGSGTVTYRYSDFWSLDFRTDLELVLPDGLATLSSSLEGTGWSVSFQGVTGSFTRVALDLRGAVAFQELLLRGRAFAGAVVTASPQEGWFGFGQPVLLRGVPLVPVPGALVGNLELGWRGRAGIAISEFAIVHPSVWAFLDAGYAPALSSRAMFGLGLGAGGSIALFGLRPVALEADIGYGLQTGAVTFGLRGRFWPAPYRLGASGIAAP